MLAAPVDRRRWTFGAGEYAGDRRARIEHGDENIGAVAVFDPGRSGRQPNAGNWIEPGDRGRRERRYARHAYFFFVAGAGVAGAGVAGGVVTAGAGAGGVPCVSLSIFAASRSFSTSSDCARCTTEVAS